MRNENESSQKVLLTKAKHTPEQAVEISWHGGHGSKVEGAKWRPPFQSQCHAEHADT